MASPVDSSLKTVVSMDYIPDTPPRTLLIRQEDDVVGLQIDNGIQYRRFYQISKYSPCVGSLVTVILCLFILKYSLPTNTD